MSRFPTTHAAMGLLIGVALLGGMSCAQARTSRPEPFPNSSAQVIKGSEMSGNLLDGLRRRVTSMNVTYPSGRCPRITFRGRPTTGNPSVYVDGTLMVDTCVLMSLSTVEIDRVEIYPSGGTIGTGMQSNPNGVIVVYGIRR